MERCGKFGCGEVRFGLVTRGVVRRGRVRSGKVTTLREFDTVWRDQVWYGGAGSAMVR